jgi:hypothetical protein
MIRSEIDLVDLIKFLPPPLTEPIRVISNYTLNDNDNHDDDDEKTLTSLQQELHISPLSSPVLNKKKVFKSYLSYSSSRMGKFNRYVGRTSPSFWQVFLWICILIILYKKRYRLVQLISVLLAKK